MRLFKKTIVQRFEFANYFCCVRCSSHVAKRWTQIGFCYYAIYLLLDFILQSACVSWQNRVFCLLEGIFFFEPLQVLSGSFNAPRVYVHAEYFCFSEQRFLEDCAHTAEWIKQGLSRCAGSQVYHYLRQSRRHGKNLTLIWFAYIAFLEL